MDVMEAARQAEAAGRHIIHMEVGQPGTGAPAAAMQALGARLGDDPLGYTVALGLPALRARIAGLYREWYDLDLDPERVVITSGSSGGFILTFSALFDSGARVGIGAPGYPSYRQILRALGMAPVDIPTGPEARYQPVPGDVATYDLDGLLVASPANPTGTMLDKAALADLMAAARAQGTAFISDEIYHGLHYGDRATTALEVSDDCYVINSFSKYFSMTGWRIGWLVVPEDQVRVVERLAQNLFICPPHVSQVAALATLDCQDACEANRAVYRANRDLVMAALPEMGLTQFAPPDGAFYVYVDVSHLTDDSRVLCAEILRDVGVAATPGLDFDPLRGQGTVRLSYARSTADIEDGLDRLRRFFLSRQ